MTEYDEMDPRRSSHVDTLLEASKEGNLMRVEALVGDDPALVDLHGCLCDENLRKMHAEDGWTALHVAAHYGQMDVLKYLIFAGANLEAVSKNPIACTPLGAAAAGQQLEAIRELLDHGADVNAANSHGYTVLHFAAAENNADLARMALGRGVDQSLQGKDGKTAKDVALEKGHKDILGLLDDE